MSVQAPEENAELLAVKRRRAELLSRKVELARNCGLSFYRPHEKQRLFHEAWRFRYRMVRAGNRFGKSHMGAAEDASWLLGERLWYPTDHPMRRAGLPQRPVKGLIITTDSDIIKNVWSDPNSGKLWRFLPKKAVRGTSRDSSGAIATIRVNDSFLAFDTVRSYANNPQGSESMDWDFIHVDEPCTKGQFDAQARGLLDRGGSVWFTLTPLREPWISDMFFPEDGPRPDDVWAIEGSMYDNPTLNAEARDAYIRNLNEDEKECRIYGLPLHMAGLVYKEFCQSDHVVKELPAGWADWETPPAHWPIYVAIDPHPQTPHAVLFCAVSPEGRHYYFYDMFVRCGITDLVRGSESKGIRGILPFLKGRRPVWAKMDPLGFIEDPEDRTCMATEAADAGLPVEKATKALDTGIIRVKQQLTLRDGRGIPPIRFFPTCRRTLWEIRRYCWDERQNRPKDENDHMMECLYRLEISNMYYVDCVASSKTRAVEEETFEQTALDLEPISLSLL